MSTNELLCLQYRYPDILESEDLMLDAYIIDQIRRREEERRRIHERPALQLPLPIPEPRFDLEENETEQQEPKRVIVIEL